jgi:hypothetical protein
MGMLQLKIGLGSVLIIMLNVVVIEVMTGLRFPLWVAALFTVVLSGILTQQLLRAASQEIKPRK